VGGSGPERVSAEGGPAGVPADVIHE
jgi:hypothetical protein